MHRPDALPQDAHVQLGVGHYGVFSGRRWQQQIYPRLRELIQGVWVRPGDRLVADADGIVVLPGA